jgi:hypothetical protein
MDRGAMLFGATLSMVIAVLTSFASSKAGEPDANGAVAAAIRHYLTDFVGVDVIAGKDSLGPLVLCIGSKVPLEMDAIERDFAGTIVRTIPVGSCTSETVEGDFGMFAALTRYYDATGREADHLEIVEVSCANTSMCVVDVDSFGSGDRYVVRREGRTWSVVRRSMRWVV